MERTLENMRAHVENLFPGFEGEDCSEVNLRPFNPETGKKLLARLVTWLKDNVGQGGYDSFLINLCWPSVEMAEDRLMIRLWMDGKDRSRGFNGRRTLKPNKALKHMFPFLTHKEAQEFGDRLRHDLGERQYTLKTAQDAKTFKTVYIGTQCRMENPSTTFDRKSLANSCMRYESIMHKDKNRKLRHPAEAYASGEFTLVYVTDQKGHIASRCVVWTKPDKPVPAPIYGVCEKSMDIIQEHLDSIGADKYCEDWIGAELDRIPGLHGGYIAPYLDIGPRYLRDNGDLLIVSRRGDINASNYSGLLDAGHRATCENCHESYNPDDGGGEVDNMPVCQCCYEDSMFCEYYEDSTFQDGDIVNLYVRGRIVQQWWSEGAIDSHTENIDGEYWHRDNLLQDVNEDYFTPRQLDNGEYFLSDWDGEYYPIEGMCETKEGDIVHKSELDNDHGIWEQGVNGVWYNVQIDSELETRVA